VKYNLSQNPDRLQHRHQQRRQEQRRQEIAGADLLDLQDIADGDADQDDAAGRAHFVDHGFFSYHSGGHLVNGLVPARSAVSNIMLSMDHQSHKFNIPVH